jgi:hypothetical protein
MSINAQSPFRTQNLAKKDFLKMNIMGLCGTGIIIGEEDIMFKEGFESFKTSSTIRCKSRTGLLYKIKVTDIERETRNNVGIKSSSCRKSLGLSSKDID